jgi:hypothetical protein
LNFGDSPVFRELSDFSGNPLAANYTGGSVGVTAAVLEGDVSPRPSGNSAVTVSDWVQVGRYAARLDYPTNGSEFQRADCAPRDTLGDGAITVIDWVQAGRYAANLDPMTVAGGPTNEVVGPVTGNAAGGVHKLGANSRQLLVTSGLLFSGQAVATAVDLVAQGDENALGFSLAFDPTMMTLSSATLGANAANATLNINTNQAAQGKIGAVIGLQIGSKFPAGTQELVRLTFRTASTNSTTASLAFADLPIPRQISDVNATALTASYVGSSISINPLPSLTISPAGQNITLSWPGWATNYLLQTSDSLSPSGTWSNAPVTVSFTNGAGVVTLPLSSQAQFYRLFHP